RRELAPFIQHTVGELLLDGLYVRRISVRSVRHCMPSIAGVVTFRRLSRVEDGDLAGSERDPGRNLTLRNLVMKREELLQRLAAEIDLESFVDVRVKVGAEMTRRFLQAEMQPEQGPVRMLEALDLRPVGFRKLLETDHLA